MAIEIVDGTLEPAQPQRLKRGYGRFSSLRIATADGQTRAFARAHTGEPVTSEVVRGGRGRWYFTTADGALGLFGVRRPDGAAHYAHFSNIEPLLLYLGIPLGLVGSAARLLFDLDVPSMVLILTPLLVVAWFYLRAQRLKAKAAFDADRR